MAKIFLFITLIFLTNTNFSYAQSKKPIAQNNQEDLLVKVHRYQNLHQSILNDQTLLLDEKIFFIFDSLDNAVKELSQQEFKFVVTAIDQIIFLDSNDPKILSQQVNFLGYYTASRDAYWPFTKSKEELKAFYKNNLFKLRKDPSSSVYYLSEEMSKIGDLANQGKFDEALEQLVIFEKAMLTEREKSNNEYLLDHELLWKTISDGMRFRLFFEKGDLKKASIYADKLDKNLQSIIENKDKSKRDKKNFEDAKKYIKMQIYYFQYDFQIGKYDRIINRALQITSAFDINYNDLEELRAFSDIYKTLSDAYLAKGDEESIKKYKYYFDIYLDLYKKAPQNDMGWLIGQIHEALRANDSARYNEILTYYDTSNLLNDKTTQESYNDIKKIYLANTPNYFSSSKANRDKILRNIWIELALYLDRGIYLNLENSNMPIYRIGYYKSIYSYFVQAGEKEVAASYAKKYINTLQDFRRQLKDFNRKDLNSFTENNSENLKEFSSNFYDVGDYESSLACMRILKENDFLDFVRRSNENENFLTNLDYTANEKDYFARLELLADQINILIKSNNKNDSNISKKIEDKKREFISAQNAYKKLARNTAKENISKLPPRNNILNLSNNEAALLFSINPNIMEIQLHEYNKKPLMFRASIDSNKFQVKILTIQKNLSLNKNVSEADWNELSSYLFAQPKLNDGKSLADFFKNKNYTKLKLQTDGYLNLIPLTLVPINGQNFGASYTTEKIGLSNKNKLTVNDNFGIDAFGATKGNSEFKTNLPGVKNEIEKIMEVGANTKNKRQFIDDKFNKLNFYNSFENNTAFIHLATHFKIGSSLEPSKMLLGDGSILTLDEMRSDIKPISTNLLTLSACNTGDSITSNLTKSNEGLSSVFQLKGAKNVISTLWEIDDQATADFMTIFYSLLLNNELSPGEALFYTQNIFRTGSLDSMKIGLTLPSDRISNKILANISKYKQPYYWAAFQISSIN
jgi:CHAT domain-containing protein